MISVDHKWRDGFTLVRLGEILRHKFGHDVVYIRNGLEKYYLPVHRPDVVVWNHVQEASKQSLAREVVASGALVVLLPTEGLPTMLRHRSLKDVSMCGIDLSSVTRFLFWSDYVKDAFLRFNSSLSIDSAVSTGAARFDVYHKSNSWLLSEKSFVRRGLQIANNDRVALLATNFVQAKFLRNCDHLVAEIKKHTAPNRTALEEMDLRNRAEMFIREDFESRNIFLASVTRIAREVDDLILLIKPHPQEDFLFYERWIGRQCAEIKTKVRLIKDMQIWDCINICDVEISRSCTTAVESWLLEKPTIDFQLNPSDYYVSDEHASGSLVAKSLDQLVSQIKFCLDNPRKVCSDLSEKRSEFIGRWFYKPDGLATFRVANEIDRVAKANFRIKQKNVKELITVKAVKNFLIGIGLYLTGDRIHDLKVLGFREFFRRSKIDRLGRSDKYISRSDLKSLQDKFTCEH